MGNQTVRTVCFNCYKTSVSLCLLLRPWLYHVLNRKQSNSQPRVENGPTCRPGLILCHRVGDGGQKAITDMGTARREDCLLPHRPPQSFPTLSKHWTAWGFTKITGALTTPLRNCDWESPAVKLRTTNGTGMVKEISQAAPESGRRR